MTCTNCQSKQGTQITGNVWLCEDCFTPNRIEPITPDIVIPLANMSKWQDNELRYTLRGIEKYLTGYGKIFIVGDERKWLQGVEYVSCETEYTSKQKNIFDRILAACNDDRVSDAFIMFNDDHFLLQYTDVSELKYWKWSTLQALGIKAGGTYQRTVFNTAKKLAADGCTQHNFDIHVPIVYEKDKFITLADEDWSRDYCIKSLYCNKFNIPGTDMPDLVLGKPFTRDEIRKVISTRQWFSINDAGLNGAVKDVLGEVYPDKSKFEK